MDVLKPPCRLESWINMMLWYLLASSLGVLYSDLGHSLKSWITKYKCQDVICHRQVKSTIMVFKSNSTYLPSSLKSSFPFTIEFEKSSLNWQLLWKRSKFIDPFANGYNSKPCGLRIRPSVISHWTVHMILKCHFVFVYTDSRYRLRHSGALRHLEGLKP